MYEVDARNIIYPLSKLQEMTMVENRSAYCFIKRLSKGTHKIIVLI